MAQLAFCPSCRRELRVPEALLGHAVRCPECATIFTTSADGGAGTAVAPAPPPPPSGIQGVEGTPASSRKPEAPEPGEPVADFDRPYRRYRRRDVEPHRGTTILVLGILGLVVAPLILGPIAWILGNTDIKKIRAGTMDPEGEGNTNAGRICGIIATIYGLVSCLCVGIGMVMWFFFMATTIQNMPQKTPPPTPRVPGPNQPNRPGPPKRSVKYDDFQGASSQLLARHSHQHHRPRVG